MFFTLYNYYIKWMYPQPPPNYAYGFKWQAGQGVPNQLSVYNLTAGVGPGIYVVFEAKTVEPGVDPFGRVGPGAPGPVFVAPAAPSAAVTTLINNLPAGQAAAFDGVTPQQLRDLTGFLSYTAGCLDILGQTAAGATLLTNINNAPYPVFITPGSMGSNQTFPGGMGYLNTLTQAILDYAAATPMPVAQVVNIINQRYASLDEPLARFNQLAQDMNNLSLCTLFQPAGEVANFLWTNFRFQDQPFTGQNLMNWLSPAGLSDFDLNVRTLDTEVEGINVREFFLLALNIVLYPNVPAGAGCGSGIKFNVQNEGDNVLGSDEFRPPAVGLAHELMHAMHYGSGTSPGFTFKHYTTTAAELLFAGIGPFAAEPVTENAIRDQWRTKPPVGLDPSNVWAAPKLRNVYEPPVPPQTPAQLREQSHCI
jgi:hypothetical protein